MKILELVLAVAPATSPSDPAPAWFSMLSSPMVLIGAVMLVFILFSNKGKRGEEKARNEMLKQMKRGDRIQTIGGIQGSVARVEDDRVEVKVDEASNVKMWFARSAIARVLDAEKSEAK